ncbi:MFS transporter [soil metagenome]
MNHDETGAFLRRYLTSTFASLKHRNFKLYALGVIFSLTGSLLQEVVVAWMAYQLTGSSLVLGGVLFAYQVPMILMGALGGIAADRFDRRKILLLSQSLAFLLSLVWLALSATNSLAVWHIYVLSSLFGIIVAFEIPARFAMIPQLVDKEDMINAFSLDGLLFYGGRVMGPVAGALILVLAGPTLCFAANSLTYLLELGTLRKIQPAPREKSDSVPLLEAIAAIARNGKTRSLLLFVAALTFFGVYIPLMPVFSHNLGGGSQLNGALIAVSEIGAIIGSIFLAHKTARTANHISLVESQSEKTAKQTDLRRTIAKAGLAFAVLIVMFSCSTNIYIALALIAPIGFTMTLVTIGAHALLQDEVEDRLRGVASTIFWMYCYFGMLALGGPFMGFLLEHLSISQSFGIAGAICFASAAAFLSTTSTKR